MKVAIVGSAPSSTHLAPYNNSEWEIWGLNEQYHTMPRWDRWFQLHNRRLCEKGLVDSAHWEWLTAQEKPVYMIDHFPEVPGCQKYPLERILSRFGGYFTNSISYMIALALDMGATEIGIYGVDMAGASEYGEQRPSCEYFVGLARGMGVNVYIPPEAELCKTPYLYGFEEMPEVLQKVGARISELKGRADRARANRIQSELEESYLLGAMEDAEYFYKNWTINGSLQRPI